jgi:plasmid stabilization system protein ParE
MSTPYRLSRRALRELRAICRYIAYDSPQAALRVERAILAACLLLADAPEIGVERKDITTLPVRFWTVSRFPNYQIVYRLQTEPLTIIAILDGNRDIGAALREPKRD